MRCEVVAVGTELLLGQIVDTNSAWIGGRLAEAGIDSHFQTKVGDNLARMVGCFRLALARSDAVIVCGGLGPTQDDITREAIAEVMGVPLIFQPELGERIRALFAARNRAMAANNMRQAEVPQGATPIPEMPGTAPGLICPVGDKVIYAVPGVPHEMRAMMIGTIIPDLRRRAGVPAVIRSRVLRTWGQSESGLAEMLAHRIEELDELGTATLAFQASGIEGIRVRITAKAGDQEAARAVLAEEEERLRAILGEYVFGTDEETMESVVLDLLRRSGKTLAVGDALTGGLVGARLGAVPGAEEVFRGALAAFAGDVASRLLGVPEGPVEAPETALLLARGARELLHADVGLGLAAPGTPDDAAPGAVYLGLSAAGHEDAREVRLPGDRERLRQYAVISLLDVLRRTLLSGAIG